MSYRAFAVIPPNVDLSLAGLADRLASRLALFTRRTVHLVVQDDTLTLLVDEWSLHLALATGPHERAESRGIAQMFAKERADAGSIAASARRIEVRSDPDPEVVYFNGYI